jgi:hypothetical protein
MAKVFGASLVFGSTGVLAVMTAQALSDEESRRKIVEAYPQVKPALDGIQPFYEQLIGMFPGLATPKATGGAPAVVPASGGSSDTLKEEDATAPAQSSEAVADSSAEGAAEDGAADAPGVEVTETQDASADDDAAAAAAGPVHDDIFKSVGKYSNAGHAHHPHTEELRKEVEAEAEEAAAVAAEVVVAANKSEADAGAEVVALVVEAAKVAASGEEDESAAAAPADTEAEAEIAPTDASSVDDATPTEVAPTEEAAPVETAPEVAAPEEVVAHAEFANPAEVAHAEEAALVEPAAAPAVEAAPAEEEAAPAATEVAPDNVAPAVEDVATLSAATSDKVAPGDSAPVEVAPAEAAAEDAAPAEAAPAEAASAETAPVEDVRTESAPAETTPAEAAPAEAAPVETAPVEDTPVDTASVDGIIAKIEHVVEDVVEHFTTPADEPAVPVFSVDGTLYTKVDDLGSKVSGMQEQLETQLVSDAVRMQVTLEAAYAQRVDAFKAEADEAIAIAELALAKSEAAETELAEYKARFEMELYEQTSVAKEDADVMGRNAALEAREQLAADRDALMQEMHGHIVAQELRHRSTVVEEIANGRREITEECEANMMIQLGEERARRIVRMEDLFVRVKGVERVLGDHVSSEISYRESHALLMAAACLETAIESRGPLAHEVEVMRKASTEPLVQVALDTIPQTALEHGVVPEQELVRRFATLKSEILPLTLMSEDSGPFGMIISGFFSKLLVKEFYGPMPGTRADYVLSRAEDHINKGNLEEAGMCINELTGHPRKAAEGWLADVRALLETQRALDVAKAQANLLQLRLG